MKPESFSEAIALDPTGDGVFQATVTADWSQGRAAFGGLVSGQMLRAAQSLLPLLPLRTMVLDFLAPASPGSVQLAASVLRAGRSMSRVEVQLHQGKTCCATMRAAFGPHRTTALTHLPPPARSPWIGCAKRRRSCFPVRRSDRLRLSKVRYECVRYS